MPDPYMEQARSASHKELDQWSIRTGCETPLNRAADAELRRRGFHFNPHEQRWERAAAPEAPPVCPDCDHGIAGGQPCATCGGSGYAPEPQ